MSSQAKPSIAMVPTKDKPPRKRPTKSPDWILNQMETLWVALDQQGILTPEIDLAFRSQFKALLKEARHG